MRFKFQLNLQDLARSQLLDGNKQTPPAEVSQSKLTD